MAAEKAQTLEFFTPPTLLFDWGDPQGDLRVSWTALFFDLVFVGVASQVHWNVTGRDCGLI